MAPVTAGWRRVQANRDFAGSASVARSNLAKTLDEREILGKARLTKFGIAAAEIIRRQRRSALPGHAPVSNPDAIGA